MSLYVLKKVSMHIHKMLILISINSVQSDSFHFSFKPVKSSGILSYFFPAEGVGEFPSFYA